MKIFLLTLLFFFTIPDASTLIYGQDHFPPTEKEYFEEGRQRMERADLDGAIEMFQTVLSTNRNHTPSYLSLGVIYTRQDLIDLAIEAFESAVRIDKNLLAGQLLLGQAYAAKGLNEKAKEAFERVILIKPDFASGHLLLGILYETEGKISEALKRYRLAASLKDGTAETRQAQKRIKTLLNKAGKFFDEGLKALNTGNFERAEEAFQNSLRLDPDNAFTLYNLGTIFLRKNQPDESISFLKRALDKNPKFSSARLLLGEIYETHGEIGRAILEYKTVRAEAPNQDDINGKLARQKLSQIGETEAIAKIVLTFLKKGTELLEQRQFEKARLKFMWPLIFLPEQVLAHYSLGVIALLEGKLRIAEKQFKKVIELNPTHLLAHLGLGELYENGGEVFLAREIFEKAIQLHPNDRKPRFALAHLYEKQERIDEALEVYYQITAFPGEESQWKKHAQSQIDFYENRFHVDFSSASLTYDSNGNQQEKPIAEIESSVSLGLIYFLKKRERFRSSLKLSVNTKLLHRQQLYFVNEGISLGMLWQLSSYYLVQNLDFATGRISGARQKSEKSFSNIGYTVGVVKLLKFPSETSLNLDIQRMKVFTNPIFNANRRTLRLSFFQNLKIDQRTLGRIGLSYSFLDNAVEANDQRRQSQTLSLNYSRPIFQNLIGNIGLTKRYDSFQHPDSLSIAQGMPTRRRNQFTSFNLGLSYQPRPGMSLFLRYVRQKNRSNLLTAAGIDSADLNAGEFGSIGEGQSSSSGEGQSDFLDEGGVTSLGDYNQELLTFGASASTDLKWPYPRWKNFQKRISVGLSVGYFRPSLKNFNEIIADPRRVIIQDPNHLLPSNPASNPTFLSQDKSLQTAPIGGNMSHGVEIEWEMKPRHALVLSISEWQNETVSQDMIPLQLSPGGDAILVPRSARYNLSINQFLLTWRYAFFNEPDVGRFYLNIGLFGGAYSNLSIDSLIKVTDPPIGNAFASLGSIEARSRSFTTRLGFGGAFFIRSWLSLGLEANYLFAEAAKLEVKREFPASFPDLGGVPAVDENDCRRRADTRVDGDALSVAECEDDNGVEGSQVEFLKLRLDGFEAKLMLRFHFGDGISGKTAFEGLVGWDKDPEEKSFLESIFPSRVREKLRLNGVLKNETAYRIKEPVTFTKLLFLFRLNGRYALSRKISITARTRSFYDAIYDLVDIDTISPRRFPNTILTQLPQNPASEEVAAIDIRNSRSVEIVQSGFEFREVFVDINLKQVDFRVGRQIVRWGVVTGARVTDEINPFDFSEFILRETDDRFIPLMMLRSNYFVGDSRFELIWIPEIVPHRPAPKGSEFEQFEILPGFRPVESFLDSDLSIHPDAFDNSEVAFRMMQNFSGLELGLTAFYTWDDFPASFRALDDSSEVFGGAVKPPEFSPEQKRLMIFGTTLSKSIGRFVLNAEYAYVFNKFFGTLLSVGDENPDLGEAQRDYMKYAVGLDFTYLGTDLSFSLLQQYILNWKSEILQDQVDTVTSLFARKAFMNEQIVTQMLTLYFVNEDDILLRPLVETRLSDNVKFRFGADFFIGDRGAKVGEFDFIGFFKDSDRFYLEIIRSF